MTDVPEQLSLSIRGDSPRAVDLPAPVAAVLRAAQKVAFATRIVRGCWGVGIGLKRRWELRGDCCCALSAYLLDSEAVAGPRETSPIATAARLLGVEPAQVVEFTRGFDGAPWIDSDWYRYGVRVAKEVVVP